MLAAPGMEDAMSTWCRFLALILLLVLPLASPARSGEAVRWKFATLAPEGIGWAKHIREFVLPFMDEATEGTLSVKVFWGGVLGDDEEAIAKMKAKVLEGAGLTGQGATMLCPEFAVVELPFLFRDYGEVDFIRERMVKTFDGLMAQNGFYLLSWNDQDFDQVYSTRWPMTSLEQFAKARFITWYGPLEESLLKALGADPLAVDVPDVSASVRQDRADTAIGPALWVVGAQMYSVLKFVNPMKIRYSPAIIVVNLDAWERLPAGHRARIEAGRLDLNRKYCGEIRKDNEKCLEAMLQYGLSIVSTPPAEMEKIRARALTVWDANADKLYPRSTLDEVLGHLEQYRAEK